MSVAAGYHHVAVALRRARSVAVCAHVRPDGDAIGSVLGLVLALRDAGISAVPTLADPGVTPPITYEFLPGFGLYTPVADLEPPEVFVALDTPNPARLGGAITLAEAAGTICVVDHHPDAEEWGEISVIDGTASATCEMIWHLLSALDVKPSPETALCLYVGLCTDTGRFQYDNTTSTTLRVAAEMLDAGVDAADAARLVYQSKRPQELALEARAMSRLTVVNGGHVAYSWVDESDFSATGAHHSEAEHLPDSVRCIAGIDIALFFRMKADVIRTGLRSKTGFNVADIAHSFGGGGHYAAAGFEWSGSLEGLLERLLPMLPGGAT